MAIHTEKPAAGPRSPRKMHGLLALSPLLVFLVTYLVTSIVAQDFYRVPVAAAFIAAAAYVLLITRSIGKTDDKIAVFSRGAGHPNILLMIWIFVLAGAFAATAREIGAIDATVQLALRLLPGKLIYAGLFLAACFISMAIGTSVGTIVALVPIAGGIAEQTGIGIPLVTAIVVGGAFFGDNLSFISDTTIAATRSLGCRMKDKFIANLWIALPAALFCILLYATLLSKAGGTGADVVFHTRRFLLTVPYLFILGAALGGVNVLLLLALALALSGAIGLSIGYDVPFLAKNAWHGVLGMGQLIVVTIVAAVVIEVVRHLGWLQRVMDFVGRKVKSPRAAELAMAALVSVADILTANNTIAILSVGPLCKELTEHFGMSKLRAASILDTFSCVAQGFLPYGAQLLIAAGLAHISPFDIIPNLHYPMVLGVVALCYILLRKKVSVSL